MDKKMNYLHKLILIEIKVKRLAISYELNPRLQLANYLIFKNELEFCTFGKGQVVVIMGKMLGFFYILYLN